VEPDDAARAPPRRESERCDAASGCTASQDGSVRDCSSMNIRGDHNECAQASPRKQPNGAVPSFKATNDSHRGEPSAGNTDGQPRLDRVGNPCRGNPGQQAEECGRPAAAPEGITGSDGAEGNAVHASPGVGGPNPLLRTGAVSVRAHRDTMVTRPPDAARFLQADGGGWRSSGERIRGGAGGGGGARRPDGAGRGHDSPGGSHPRTTRWG
jgi:hypothetical protein